MEEKRTLTEGNIESNQKKYELNRQLNKDRKKLESEIKDAEFDLTMKKNMYNLGVVQLDKLIGYYKDTYM